MISGRGGLDIIVAVSVVVSYVDVRETHIDADGAHIVDLCKALKVRKSKETIHDETSDSVISGVGASYNCLAETVKKHGALSAACLSPNNSEGIAAKEEAIAERTPTSGAVSDIDVARTVATGPKDELGAVPKPPDISVKKNTNADATS